MQNRSQFYQIFLPFLKWVGMMSLIGLMFACDNSYKNNTKDIETKSTPVTQTQAQDNVPENKLVFKLEGLNFDTICSGQQCPDIKIQRLNSNYIELDASVDRYIYNYMSSFLQGFDVADSAASVDTAATTKSSTASPVQDVQKIKKQLNTQANGEIADNQQTKLLLEHQVKPFVEKFLILYQEVKSLGSPAQLSVFIKPQVLSANGPVATVVINANNYVGGAHGSSAQQYLNFELSTKKILSLDNIVLDNKRKELSEIVYQKFQNWVKDTQPEIDFSEYEKLWSFQLSNNFYLAPQGLVFQYGEYEIGPYVSGLPRLVVPYDELNGILKNNYLPLAESKEPAVQP